MRRGLLLEIVVLVLAGAFLAYGYATTEPPIEGFDPGPRERGTLRVMTWNVGESLTAGGGPLDDEHLRHVVRTIREFEPNLVLLQEIADADQARSIEEQLGRRYDAFVPGGRGGRRVAIVVRWSDVRTFPVPELGPRALGAVLTARWHPPVVALNLHANAFSARRRNEAVGTALAALEARTEGPAKILGGDLNLDLDLDKRRDLFSDDDYLDVETYNHLANRLLDAAGGKGPTAEPDRRLDYLFVAPRGFAVIRSGVLKGLRRGDMDHDPVLADLRWR